MWPLGAYVIDLGDEKQVGSFVMYCYVIWCPQCHPSLQIVRARETMLWLDQAMARTRKRLLAVCGLRLSDADSSDSEATATDNRTENRCHLDCVLRADHGTSKEMLNGILVRLLHMQDTQVTRCWSESSQTDQINNSLALAPQAN